jgi:hypothetical protein
MKNWYLFSHNRGFVRNPLSNYVIFPVFKTEARIPLI